MNGVLVSGMDALQSNDEVDEDGNDNGGSEVDDALNASDTEGPLGVRYLAFVWMGSCNVASDMVCCDPVLLLPLPIAGLACAIAEARAVAELVLF